MPPQSSAYSSLYLVKILQVLALFQNVLSNEDIGICKQNVHELIDAIQALLPHLWLPTDQTAKSQLWGWNK